MTGLINWIYIGVIVAVLALAGVVYRMGYSAGSDSETLKQAAIEMEYAAKIQSATNAIAVAVDEANLARAEQQTVIQEKYINVIKEVVKYEPIDNCELDDDFMRIYESSLPTSSTSE